jgi:hypothetical protein
MPSLLKKLVSGLRLKIAGIQYRIVCISADLFTYDKVESLGLRMPGLPHTVAFQSLLLAAVIIM